MTGFERAKVVIDYPDNYRVAIRLRDGTMVTLRPIRPDDEPLLAAFHLTLSEQSVYLRYFSPIDLSRRIDQARLARVCRADQMHDIVMVAEWIYPTDVPLIVAVGRLTRSPAPTVDEAEFAIIVSDEWQQHGLGHAMLEQLIEIAYTREIRRLLAYILPENNLMLRLCEHLGCQLTFDSRESLLRAVLKL